MHSDGRRGWVVHFEDRWSIVSSQTTNAINILCVLSVVAMYIADNIKRKRAGLRIFEKKNDTVFADEKRQLEFVSFPRINIEYYSL